MNNLEEIAWLVNRCADCELSRGRNKAVPGEGSPQADLMFIGEGPGYHEDRLGRPFVGPAGQFLDDLLMSIGLKRADVFIANMVKCRPPQNRDPLPAEMSACSKYLDRQIELIDPKLIITLGRFSLTRFFPGETITRARGKVREKEGRWIYPIMHPAAALHREENRSTIVSDFKEIPRILERLDRPSSPLMEDQPVEPQKATAPQAQQLSLFSS
ncbi:MAG: uracil-DNA glycosylase [SAR202 cluster bacterium Io17-Chloro-G2]|nr:MAG: uracil-DNA glycosylase [SAR202 cluster bacterium Io17-Chloro-G2]